MKSLKTWLLGPSEQELAQQALERLGALYSWFDARPERLVAAFLALDSDDSIARLLGIRQLKIDSAAAGDAPRLGYDAAGLALADTLLAGAKTEQAEQLTRAGAYRTLLLWFHVSPPTCVKLEDIYRSLVRDLGAQIRKHPDLIRGHCGNLIGLIAEDLGRAGLGATAIPLTRALAQAAEAMHAAQLRRAAERASRPVPVPRPVPPPANPPSRPAAPLSRRDLFELICREALQDGALEERETSERSEADGRAPRGRRHHPGSGPDDCHCLLFRNALCLTA